jgi:hypothetical protein
MGSSFHFASLSSHIFQPVSGMAMVWVSAIAMADWRKIAMAKSFGRSFIRGQVFL